MHWLWGWDSGFQVLCGQLMVCMRAQVCVPWSVLAYCWRYMYGVFDRVTMLNTAIDNYNLHRVVTKKLDLDTEN